MADNIEIIYLDIGKKGQDIHNQSLKNLLTYARKSYTLASRLCKQERFDATLCWSYPAIGIGYILKKRFAIPYITLLRGSDVPYYEQKWKRLDRYIFRWLAPILWRNSQHVMANSQKLRDMALAIVPSQEIGIIENGVDTEFYSPDVTHRDTSVFRIL